MGDDTYYTVGVITSPHGLRGEVKVFPRTDFPQRRFAPGSELYLRSEGGTPFRIVQVANGRQQKQLWIVSFVGVQTIADVENWRRMELCVPASALMPLPEGHYYVHQLVGLKVMATDGRYVGELVEVLTPGANDVYVVRGPLQAKDLLLPAIPNCIQDVDVARGMMTVSLLPGLLEADEV